MKNIIKKIGRLLTPRKVTNVTVSTISPQSLLQNKNVVITGGSRGIGFFIAKKCIEEGGNVLIIGRNEHKLIEAAKELKHCKYLNYDLSDCTSASTFFDKCEELLGGCVDILINNAGISLHEGNYTKVTHNSWDSQFSINLKTPYFLSQEFAMRFIRNKQANGSIIFITSERGLYQCDDIPYGLIKSAINSLTHGLGRRLLDYGIRVNAVAPGVTVSDMTGFSREGNLYRERSCSHRVYLPEEVAETVVFLISDSAKCISSQIVACNNGNNFKCPW